MQNTEQAAGNSPSQETLEEELHPLVFTGKGSEYFGIWVVNLLLTILTLGIYSAWAKVRRMHYFYRNTSLAGSSFDYHGKPTAILKGRLIAFAMLITYNFAGQADPILGLSVAAVFVCLLPRLLLKSLQFRLHNSSYRGLRFRFNGKLNDAYVVFLLLPVASILTLYLFAPFCHQRIKRFQHNNSAFGQTSFFFNAPVRSFYLIYLKVLGIAIAGGAVLAFFVSFVLQSPSVIAQGKANPQAIAMFSMLPIFLFFVLMVLIRPYLEARLQNLIWNNTYLGPHRFVSRISARKLFGIMATNLIGIVLTLGLFRPFAVTRLLKYRAESVTLVAAGNLDGFLANNEPAVGATGEEAADLFDIEIGL